MLWVMYSQWDQGLCWTVMIDVIWSVICHSHLQLPLVSWKVELLGRTFLMYNGPKVQTKQYLGRHHTESHCKHFLSFSWNTRHMLFFLLDYGKFWLFFYFIVVVFWDLIHYFFMMCSLPVYNASTSNQLTNSMGENQWTCHLRVFYPRKECAF